MKKNTFLYILSTNNIIVVKKPFFFKFSYLILLASLIKINNLKKRERQREKRVIL